MLFSLLHVTLGKSHALSGSQFVHLQKEGDEVRSLQTFLAPSPHGSGMQLFPPGWRRERERLCRAIQPPWRQEPLLSPSRLLWAPGVGSRAAVPGFPGGSYGQQALMPSVLSGKAASFSL